MPKSWSARARDQERAEKAKARKARKRKWANRRAWVKHPARQARKRWLPW